MNQVNLLYSSTSKNKKNNNLPPNFNVIEARQLQQAQTLEIQTKILEKLISKETKATASSTASTETQNNLNQENGRYAISKIGVNICT